MKKLWFKFVSWIKKESLLERTRQAEYNYEEHQNLRRNVQRLKEYHSEETLQLAIKHEKDLKRVEMEVIILKDLIQEKNIVIDKLLLQGVKP